MGSQFSRAVLLLSAVFALAAQGQEGQGFAEVRLALFPGVEGKLWQVVERVRPTLKTELSERVRLVATIEAGLSQGRNTQEELERVFAGSGLPSPLSDSSSFANRTLRINGSDDYLDVDRLYFDFYGERFDLRAGRQALNWGSAQFFNPTDPFPEVLLAEPWRPRRGVNAARLSVPFGEANDVSAVIASNDALTQLRAAGRVRFNWNQTDFALVGAWRGDSRNALIGVDLRGTLEVGWWIEAAYLLGRQPHEELALGIDYSFAVFERALVFLQYYRNGAGTPDITSIPGNLLARSGGGAVGSSEERDPFAPFTIGRDFGLLGGSLVFTPELSASLAVLQSLNDGTGFAVPTVSYAALGWLEVAASAQVPYDLTGSGGEFKPREQDLQLTLPAGAVGQNAAVKVDLRGLLPVATFTLWTRASF